MRISSVGEYGRRDVGAILPCGFYGIAAAQQARAVLRRCGCSSIPLIAVEQKPITGPKLVAASSGSPHANARDAGDDGVLNAAWRVYAKHPCAVGTHFGRCKIRHHRNVRRQLDVRVGTDDERRFAAQLHGYVFQARLPACAMTCLPVGTLPVNETLAMSRCVHSCCPTRVAQNHVNTPSGKPFGENSRQFSRP